MCAGDAPGLLQTQKRLVPQTGFKPVTPSLRMKFSPNFRSAGRRNSAQRGEARREQKFIGPTARRYGPAKIVKFPKLAPEVLEPFRR